MDTKSNECLKREEKETTMDKDETILFKIAYFSYIMYILF